MSYFPIGDPDTSIASAPININAEQAGYYDNPYHLVCATAEINLVTAVTGSIFPLYTFTAPTPGSTDWTWTFWPAFFACVVKEAYSGNLNTPQINIGYQSSSLYAEFAVNQSLTKVQGGALSGMFASGQFDLFAPRTSNAAQRLIIAGGANSTVYVRVNTNSDATRDIRTVLMWGYFGRYFYPY